LVRKLHVRGLEQQTRRPHPFGPNYSDLSIVLQVLTSSGRSLTSNFCVGLHGIAWSKISFNSQSVFSLFITTSHLHRPMPKYQCTSCWTVPLVSSWGGQSIATVSSPPYSSHEAKVCIPVPFIYLTKSRY